MSPEGRSGSGSSGYAVFGLVLVIAVLLGSGLYTGIIPNALHAPSSPKSQQVSTSSSLTAEQTSALATEPATPVENLVLGPNPSTLVVQLTDPPNVPAGTTSLNLTYSTINLVVAVPASKDGQVTPQTVALNPQGGSATLDLLGLQNVSQTIAAANLPNGTTIYSLFFTVTGVSIAVDGNVSAVALATGASALQVTLARSSPLYGTNAFLVELYPTVVNTPTGYQMIPSAVGILKTQQPAAGGSSGDHVGSTQAVSSKDKGDLNNAKGNVTATITALTVSGNVTTLNVLVINTGEGPVNLEALGLAGNFTAVGPAQACTQTTTTQTTTSSQTSTTTYRPPTASGRIGFTDIKLANDTSGYLYGRGEGGYSVSHGKLYFSLAFSGQRPGTHFSLILSVNGTTKTIGDYTTNSLGTGKVVASTELANGSFAMGLTIVDDSTFGQPTPVLASDPATFTVAAHVSSTTTSTSTTSKTNSTTTHTEPETRLYYHLVPVLPTLASGGNASGYAGVGVSGHSISIGWYIKGALPGEKLQMIMQANGSSGEKSFPLAPVIVNDEGSVGSQATFSLDYGTYSIGLIVVDLNTTTPNTTVLTSVPASAQVTIQAEATTTSTSSTSTTSTTSTTTSVTSITSTNSSYTNSTALALESSDSGKNGPHCEHLSGLIFVPIMATSTDETSTTATTSTSMSTTSSSTASASTATTAETCSQGKLALVQGGEKPHEGAHTNVLAAGQCVELSFTGQITFGHSVTVVPSTEAGQTYVLGVLGTGESLMMKCVLPADGDTCTEITHP